MLRTVAHHVPGCGTEYDRIGAALPDSVDQLLTPGREHGEVAYPLLADTPDRPGEW